MLKAQMPTESLRSSAVKRVQVAEIPIAVAILHAVMVEASVATFGKHNAVAVHVAIRRHHH